MLKKTINKNEKLYQALLSLSKRAIDKTLAYRDDGKLAVIPYQYIPVKDIDYLMGTYQYDRSKLEYFDFYDWSSKDFVDFTDMELKTLKEFDEVAQLVIEEFDVPEHAVKLIGLPALLHKIMKEAPNGHITYDNIDSYVQLFIDGYESYRSQIPVIWNVHLWFGNTYIESDEIEIEKGVYLRRPRKEQLADVRPKPNHTSELETMMGKVLGAGAILSFSVQADNKPIVELYPEIIPQEIERWLNAFRLFKPTDLTIIYQSVNPVSIFEYSSSERKDQPQDKYWHGKIEHKETSSFKLNLKAEEEELLRTFIKNIKPALKNISHKTYLSGSSYELAFHRYNDSLVKTEVNAYKILSAITSLEALLSGGETEITFKIRMRVAKLLSLFGFDSLDVSKKVRDAYNLRSKLVHGSKPEDNKTDLLEFARKHTHEILNYNRICLLIALQVEKSINKQQLIELVNNSFIDVATDIELKNLIDENVRIPIINPFNAHS